MIQRIQTVYLFIVALIATLLLVINPTYIEIQGYNNNPEGEKENISIHFSSTDIEGNDTKVEPLLFARYALVGIGIIAVIAIFLFKNRRLQMLITAANYLFILALYILMVYFAVKYKNRLIPGADINIAIGLFFPLFLPIFNYMALLRINYDEELLRSTSRLR